MILTLERELVRGQMADRALRSTLIVIASPCFELLPRICQRVNCSTFRHSSRNRPLNDSIRKLPSQGHRSSVDSLMHSMSILSEPLHTPPPARERAPRPSSPRALSGVERQAVLDLLYSKRFVDLAPAQVHATLLDDGTYLCSERTMYRLLAAHGPVDERRAQRRHPAYVTGVVDDRAQSALELGHHEVARPGARHLVRAVRGARCVQPLRRRLAARRAWAWGAGRGAVARCYARQGIVDGSGLTAHADRECPMTCHSVSGLMQSLGITRSHSRPHVLAAMQSCTHVAIQNCTLGPLISGPG